MNTCHHLFCRSLLWRFIASTWILPWALDGVELGASTLELGPGYGVSTRALHCQQLVCIEYDGRLARRLSRNLGGSPVAVVNGDAAELPFQDAVFDGVVSMMMLHHVAPAGKQDRLFAEVFRVLRPGGVFAGCDSIDRPLLRRMHRSDHVAMVDALTLRERLAVAGFGSIAVESRRSMFRFQARKHAVALEPGA